MPEGAAVSITYPAVLSPQRPAAKRRIQLPLVHCEQAGSVLLTGERIAEILDQEDAPPRR